MWKNLYLYDAGLIGWAETLNAREILFRLKWLEMN